VFDFVEVDILLFPIRRSFHDKRAGKDNALVLTTTFPRAITDEKRLGAESEKD
jgi:hypothetical protein